MATRSAPIVTTYLEMTSAAELRPKRSADPQFRIREVMDRDWQLNRSLYLTVGEPWGWTDKRTWSDARWQQYVNTDALRTFVAEHDGEIAGYFELHRVEADVEIAYFGLMPDFIGRRFGGALLTAALEHAWEWKAHRVWVHTCSLDHPSALANYQARGLRVFRTSTTG